MLITIFCIVGIWYLCYREYKAEQREYKSKIGYSKGQVYRAYKHMRDDKSKPNFQELLQNLSKN
jgi:hypothetical protein